MKIALAQCDFTVGDLSGNFQRALDRIADARSQSAAAVLFPELAISGYPPEDLLLRPGFMRRSHEIMAALVAAIHGIDVERKVASSMEPASQELITDCVCR